MGALTDYLSDDQSAAPAVAPQQASPLAGAQRYAGGYPTGALNSSYGYDPLMALAATDMSGMRPEDFRPSPYTASLYKASQDLMGDSPLSHLNDLSRSQDTAAAAKMASINSAIDRLTPPQGGVNLPLLAAAGALLSPTRTGSFGESIGNAATAAVPAIEKQRQIDQERALLQGKLGIEAAQVPADLSKEQMNDYLNQLKLGEQYGAAAGRSQTGELMARARERAAAIAGQSRLGVAGINAQGRIDVATIGADRNRYQYIGGNPTNASEGIYLDKNTGLTHFGPATLGKGLAAADPAKIREAHAIQQEYAKLNQPLDFPTAYGMVRSGVNDLHQWNNEVEGAKKTILSAQPGLAQDKAEQMARDAVVSRRGNVPARVPQPGAQPLPGAQPITPGGGSPAPANLRRGTPDEYDAARSALTQGAPRDKVEQRLKEHGIDPSGL